MLFATEVFESFNAVIRAKSIHSNRHAPSRDIVLAFAQSNRIWHLLSGGLFQLQMATLATSARSSSTETPIPHQQLFSKQSADWVRVGDGPRQILHSRGPVANYLGLDTPKELIEGKMHSCRF